MARFTRYNNPSKKRRRRYISRTDADIVASKAYYDDKVKGTELPLAEYDKLSDKLCGKPSRRIYESNNGF